MNRTRAGIFALAAFALAAPLALAADKQQVAQAQPAAPATTNVETPQLQILPPELSAFYAGIAAKNHVTKLAGGAKSMEFESAGMIMVAKIGADGKMTSACVGSEAAARRFLQTKAPLARVAEEQ
ncbi:MAG TPA: hypothetical protein VGR02_21190 [Thermoanaerobaculia bacterium]|nr:hypothetical protein [Thermoanaerobaculia bacterium]